MCTAKNEIISWVWPCPGIIIAHFCITHIIIVISRPISFPFSHRTWTRIFTQNSSAADLICRYIILLWRDPFDRLKSLMKWFDFRRCFVAGSSSCTLIVQLFENPFSWHSAHTIRILMCMQIRGRCNMHSRWARRKKKGSHHRKKHAETHKGLIKGNEKAHKKIFINFWPFLWMESRRAQAKIYSFCIPGLGYLLIGFLQVKHARKTLHYSSRIWCKFLRCSLLCKIEGGGFL